MKDIEEKYGDLADELIEIKRDMHAYCDKKINEFSKKHNIPVKFVVGCLKAMDEAVNREYDRIKVENLKS